MISKYRFLLVAAILAAIIILFKLSPRQPEPALIPALQEGQGPISFTSDWRNTKAAIAGLRSTIRRNPDDLHSKLRLAFAYIQEARITGEHPYYYPAALQLIGEVLESKPDKPVIVFEATVAKAAVQLSLHQFDEALQTAKKAQQLNPRSALVYGVLCDAYVELGHYPQAIQMADQMVALRPDLKSYSRISYLREIHGDRPGAIEAMNQAATTSFPGLEQTAWTRVALGHLHEKCGELKKAQLQYRQALAAYPDYAFALAGLGRLAALQNKTDEALRLFTQAAEIIPEFSFRKELIRLYQQKGETKKAAQTMQELLASLQEDQQAGHVVDLELANIYLELAQDYDKAAMYARKAYKSRPGNIDVCRTMAHIYYKKQDFWQAAVYIRKACRTNSQDPALLCLRGLIFYKGGQQDLGERLIRLSFALNPYLDTPLSQEGKGLLRKAITRL